MTQSSVAKNIIFSVTLYNFQKSGRAIAQPAPPPPPPDPCTCIYLVGFCPGVLYLNLGRGGGGVQPGPCNMIKSSGNVYNFQVKLHSFFCQNA